MAHSECEIESLRYAFIMSIESNRIELNRNGIIQYVGNSINISLQLSPSLFPKCPFFSILFSHQSSFLCFNSTLQHSSLFSITRSTPLSPYAHSIITRIKLKFNNPLAAYLRFLGQGIWQKINIWHHHQHTLVNIHDDVCNKKNKKKNNTETAPNSTTKLCKINK